MNAKDALNEIDLDDCDLWGDEHGHRMPDREEPRLPRGGACLTGSRVYGVPRTNSDIDLVILVTPEELAILAAVAAETGDRYLGQYRTKDGHSECLRFGRLNLIALSSADEFAGWEVATEALKAVAPVTRAEAKVGIKSEISRRTGISFKAA